MKHFRLSQRMQRSRESDMSLSCTRCESSGFLNIDQCPIDAYEDRQGVLEWIATNEDHDVQVCDCCGDSYEWYGVPGEHYNSDDPAGPCGPYAYNGGLCECN